MKPVRLCGPRIGRGNMLHSIAGHAGDLLGRAEGLVVGRVWRAVDSPQGRAGTALRNFMRELFKK